MKTVLITGGSGFLGINLIRALREKGVEQIRVLDIADFDYPEKSEPWLAFTKGDVRDMAAVEKCVEGCDLVVKGSFRSFMTGHPSARAAMTISCSPLLIVGDRSTAP